MIANEIKTIVRKHLHQKTIFGINLLGLTMGLVFTIFAFLYTQYEFNFDKHFTNTNNTYLLACNNGRDHKMHFGQPAVFMDAIVSQVPEIKSGIRILYSDENLNINKTRYKAIDLIYADSAFFNFIGWNLIIGNPAEVIARPMTIAISEKIARQYFKNTSPIGKIINISNQFNFTITGVFKDLPEQSHIRTDFIAALSTMGKTRPDYYTQWGWHSSYIYFKCNLNSNIATIEKKIANVWNINSMDKPCTGSHIRSVLTPVSDIYLKAGDVVGIMSAYDYQIGITIIAGLILLISCLNFINLTIAVNTKQTIENGIKKVLGAGVRFFIRQVTFEMLMYLLIALLLSFIILQAFLPAVSTFFDKTLTISLFHNTSLIIFIVFLVVFITLLCGSIPVVQMIRSKTSLLLKGNAQLIASRSNSMKTQKRFRNSLVIAQFTIGIILIISCLVVNSQLKFIRQHDIGFDKEQIMVIDNYEGDMKSRYGLLQDYVKQLPGVKSITCGSDIPLYGVSNWGGPCVASNKQISMQGCGFISVDENYLDMIGAKIKEGRGFMSNNASEKNIIIITEALARSLNLTNPIGVKLGDLWDNASREIVGVVKDIEFNTIHSKSVPVVFFYKRDYIRYHERIMIKLQSDNITGVIGSINKYWQKISPDYPMEYTFLDDKFSTNYVNESRTSVFMNVMAIVAVILCCMGLFGLALFHINARIKEIGIRKVNGAKVIEVIQMLNSDFIEWIIIAFVVAAPIAWFVLHKWLQSFAYKTELSWWVFILAGIITLVVAVFTVSWQSYKAAVMNPVESLRYE